jgi:hypothetical protein
MLQSTPIVTESLEDGSAAWLRMPDPDSLIPGEIFATFESGQWRTYAHVQPDTADGLFDADQARAMAAALSAAAVQCDALNAEIAAARQALDRTTGQSLRELRRTFNYSLEQAATLVDFPRRVLSDIEEGVLPIWDSLNAQITKAYAGGAK